MLLEVQTGWGIRMLLEVQTGWDIRPETLNKYPVYIIS
jgi:hypothetical protein